MNRAVLSKPCIDTWKKLLRVNINLEAQLGCDGPWKIPRLDNESPKRLVSKVWMGMHLVAIEQKQNMLVPAS